MRIGITGTMGAGKGAIVEYLKQKNFKHYSVRAFITEEIERRGLPVNRDTMTEVGNDLRHTHGPAYIVESLARLAEREGGDSIIESIRTVGEVDALKKQGGLLIAIDANSRMRYERITARGSATDHVTFEKFIADEERESVSEDPAKQNLKKVAALADVRILNEGTLEELYRQVDGVLAKVMRS